MVDMKDGGANVVGAGRRITRFMGDDAGCDMKKHYDMMSISLVNKNFLDILRQK